MPTGAVSVPLPPSVPGSGAQTPASVLSRSAAASSFAPYDEPDADDGTRVPTPDPIKVVRSKKKKKARDSETSLKKLRRPSTLAVEDGEG